MSDADITARGGAAVAAYLGNGATAIRTHVDVDDDIGLRALNAVIAIRDAMVGRCAVQVVAFVATPVSGPAGARNRALLNEALAAGADVVGACPGLDPAPRGCINACLEIAGRTGPRWTCTSTRHSSPTHAPSHCWRTRLPRAAFHTAW